MVDIVKENIISSLINKCFTHYGRRVYYDSVSKVKSPFTHIVWNIYNSDDNIIRGDNCVIHHKDKDTMNDNIDNLEKLTTNKHASLHSKGRILSEEIKNKISKTRIEKGLSKGKNHPNFGKSMTQEQKDKISKTKKERYIVENHPFYGKSHTEETKRKISRTKIENGDSKGKKNPMYGKSGKDSPNFGKKWSEERKRKHSILIAGWHKNRKVVLDSI